MVSSPTRSEAGSFVVGANFPWIDCGWDFGPPPPGWTRKPARDWGQVERDLTDLRTLGIEVVRWWILAGGVNYPVGRSIGDIASPVRGFFGNTVAWQLKPGAVLPALPDAFLQDFASLCQACTNAGVQLVPSLLSFEWFDRAEAYSRGRRALVMGGARDDYHAAIQRFLAATLDPLLDVSRQHRAAIHAWESINEPDWVVRGGLLNPGVARSVGALEMSALLVHATERIVRAGFTATIGFKQLNPRWLEPYARELLARTAQQGRYLHQVHHYPTRVTDRALPPASRSWIKPVVVGEFPTSNVRERLANWSWADAGLLERDPEQYLARRLELIRRRGYQGAWLWCAEPAWIKQRRVAGGGASEPDARVRWGDAQRAQVRRFVLGGGG